MDEFEIIERYFAPLAGEGSFALLDDAAVIAARPGFDLVVTTDAIAEGTDFYAFDTPSGIARKALRVNLSDLAAKGAEPAYYLLNLSLPPTITTEWLKSFAEGLADDQANFEIALLGGDTAGTEGPLAIAVTAMGYVPQGTMVRRAGAKAGHAVYVSGTIGDSGGGLQIRRENPGGIAAQHRNFLLDAYRLPKPPVWFGPSLRLLASASVDVSDGLVADLGHLAAASGVALDVDARAVPRSDALRAFWGDSAEAIVRAATAGDDYQIAFTADPVREREIMAQAMRTGTVVTRIGSVIAGEGVRLCHGGSVLPVAKAGYRHF